MEPEESIAAWHGDYGMSEVQTTLVRQWYERWQSAGAASMVIEPGEWRRMLAEFRRWSEPHWLNISKQRISEIEAERTAWARGMLAAVGIVLR